MQITHYQLKISLNLFLCTFAKNLKDKNYDKHNIIIRLLQHIYVKNNILHSSSFKPFLLILCEKFVTIFIFQIKLFSLRKIKKKNYEKKYH